MGYEYSLRFEHPGPPAVIEVLGRLPAWRKPAPGSPGFELRDEKGDPGGMPDASLRIEPRGLSFCSHGTAGNRHLGEAIARLVGAFGAVTIAELE